MDESQSKEIIKLILLRVAETGECKVGTAAREIVYYDISSSEKEELANKISRAPTLIATKKENDWLISKNPNYKESAQALGNTKKLISIMSIIGLLLSVGISFAMWTVAKQKQSNVPPQEQINNQLLNDSSVKEHRLKELADSVQKLNKDPLKEN